MSPHLQCFPESSVILVSLLFRWVFFTTSREEMFKNREMQFLVKKPKQPAPAGGKVKSGAVIITVSALNLFNVHLIH